MTKTKMIEEIKNIMDLHPQTNNEDFNYVKQLKKMTKKEFTTEYESRYTNIMGYQPEKTTTKPNNLTAELSFQKDSGLRVFLTIENYNGWVYENKTRTLKVKIENKLIEFPNIKFETIKEKIIKEK